MMRSLFAGVSGLKTHQTRMDVIGNNIANVNTVAYKSQSATFQELVYQTTQAASGANETTGRSGINAKQIGLGVQGGAISTNIKAQGASQSTGNAFDIQLNGESFFIVSDGSSKFFTRAGTFTVDANGTLCMTTNGYNVQGWQVDEEGNVIKDTVSDLRIMSPQNMSQDPEATRYGYLSGVIDSNDPNLDEAKGGSVSTLQFYDEKGYSYTLKLATTQKMESGKPVDGTFLMAATDILDSTGKSLLTKEFLADKGFDETQKVEYLASLNIFSDTSGATGQSSVELKYNTTTGAWNDSDNRTFDIDAGALGGALELGGMTGQTITVDVGTTKNIDNNGLSTVAGRTGNVNNKAVGAGREAGEMDSLSVQQDGKIYASYTNGVTKCLGQIAVATFANPAGLEKKGDNLYASTQNSGEFDGVGVDVTADGGSMTSGVLEMSNVDLSNEFTEMITTQRGFQANSRIITVSDTLLEELINLKR